MGGKEETEAETRIWGRGNQNGSEDEGLGVLRRKSGVAIIRLHSFLFFKVHLLGYSTVDGLDVALDSGNVSAYQSEKASEKDERA